MKIDIRGNTDAITKEMTRVAKKDVPKAISRGIDQTAMTARRRGIDREIQQNVHNPTAFTKRGTFFKGSSKDRKPITAIIGVMDKQAKYLAYVEEGGVSISVGKAKPVPLDTFKNKAGNIPRGKVKRILSDKKRYFSGTPKGGGRPSGIYQRIGTTKNKRSPKLRMLASWQKRTHHDKRTRIRDRVLLIVSRNIDKDIRKMMMKYLPAMR